MPTRSSTAKSKSIADQLTSTLELAANEMRAAENATTLEQAKLHAEAVVNILVGEYGRWYGDQNGDLQVTDPSDKRGVLPGEKIPASGGADIDKPAQFPFGLALLASGTQTDSSPLQVLLGDAKLWRTKARDGYDAIENALARYKNDKQLKLQGAVPRAVAYARLILTDTTSVEEARAFAIHASNEIKLGTKAAITLK